MGILDKALAHLGIKSAAGFVDLKLHPTLLETLKVVGYENPTPIQQQAIPPVMAGKDLIGLAQTGTGKTAAFALPILHRLLEQQVSGSSYVEGPEVLVLTPTRELAIQVYENFRDYGAKAGIKSSAVYGGVGLKSQIATLDRFKPRVLVATPGRLLDFMNQRVVSLASVGIFVLDEADRMLDMGFIDDVRRIVKALPTKRQTLLFSATMPKAIETLAQQVLRNPEKVAVSPVSSAVEIIDQKMCHVSRANKRPLLAHLLKEPEFSRTIVFTRTKALADRVEEYLTKGGIKARAIHGGRSQGARQAALKSFKMGDVSVLVASDIASRGIDVEDVSHVIQYDLPEVPETYVHRIGRTGRAKRSGSAISFCEPGQEDMLSEIEKHLKKKIPKLEHPFPLTGNEIPEPKQGRGGRSNAQYGRSQGGRSGGGGGRGPSRSPRGNEGRPSGSAGGAGRGPRPSGGEGAGGQSSGDRPVRSGSPGSNRGRRQ